MPLNLVEICTVKYPGQIESGNITFRNPETGLVFATWNVPNIAQPKEASILEEETQWEKPFAIYQALNIFLPYLNHLLETTAQSKQYLSALSLASYVNSSNPIWKAEADTFIKWRDDVFAYAINIQNKVYLGAPIPNFDDFVKELPAIIWS